MLRLKELRENKNLSQQDLAKALKVSPSTVSNWEAGKREPDMAMIIAISEYFGVSIDYCLGRKLETRNRRDSESEHALDVEAVNNIIAKIKKIDHKYYPALESIIDGLSKKSNQSWLDLFLINPYFSKAFVTP